MMTVYSYADAEYLTAIFNAVAMLSSTKFLKVLTNSILMFTAIYVAWGMGIYGQIRRPLVVAAWAVFALSFNSYGSVTVKVKNVANPLQQRVIKHVPALLGAIASVTSTAGYEITRFVETAFSSVPKLGKSGSETYQDYLKTGMLFGSRIALELDQVRIRDPYFKDNMRDFVQNCVLFEAQLGERYTMSDLVRSKDLWALVSKNQGKVLGIKYREGGTRTFKTCAETAAALESKWTTEQKRVWSFLSDKLFGKKTDSNGNRIGSSGISNADIQKYLPFQSSFIGARAQAIAEPLKQHLMINAIQDGTKEKAMGLGVSMTNTKSMHSLYQNFLNLGIMAANNLPIMKSIFEAILYGGFFIILAAMMLPNGYRYASAYVGILFWIQTWPIFFAIINLVMQIASGIIIGDEGVTILNRSTIYSQHSMMLALSGYLSYMVPYLSYVIMKGGAASFMHLSNTFSGPAQGASSQAAAEVSSGSLSLANISMDNSSMMNHSAFKYDSNVSHLSGEYMHKAANGMTTNSAAGQTFFTGASSDLNLRAELHAANTKTITTGISNEQSYLDSNSAQLSEISSIMKEQSYSVLSSLGQTVSNSGSYEENTNLTDNKALNAMASAQAYYREHMGMNENEASNEAINSYVRGDLSGGFKVAGIGATIGTGSSKEWSNTESISKENSFSKESGNMSSEEYQARLEKVYSIIRNAKLSDELTDAKSLQDDYRQSYNQQKSLQQDRVLHEQRLESLRTMQDQVNSQGMNWTVKRTDDILNFTSDYYGICKQDAANLFHSSSPDKMKEEVLSAYRDKNLMEFASLDTISVGKSFKSKKTALLNEGGGKIEGIAAEQKGNIDSVAIQKEYNCERYITHELKDAFESEQNYIQEHINVGENRVKNSFTNQQANVEKQLSINPQEEIVLKKVNSSLIASGFERAMSNRKVHVGYLEQRGL